MLSHCFTILLQLVGEEGESPTYKIASVILVSRNYITISNNDSSCGVHAKSLEPFLINSSMSLKY